MGLYQKGVFKTSWQLEKLESKACFGKAKASFGLRFQLPLKISGARLPPAKQLTGHTQNIVQGAAVTIHIQQVA
jgi:hypothetical protein